MDSPLGPQPVVPGLVTPRVARSNRERKRKGRSFEDELGHERDDDGAARAAPPPREQADRPRRPDKDEPGHLLDVEA